MILFLSDSRNSCVNIVYMSGRDKGKSLSVFQGSSHINKLVHSTGSRSFSSAPAHSAKHPL